MSLHVGILGVSHVHAPSYVWCCGQSDHTTLVGVWDKDDSTAAEFADKNDCSAFQSRDELINICDAIVVSGENLDHAELIEFAVSHGKHVLCEKPLAASSDQRTRIQKVMNESSATLMTAFPCPFSPAFESALTKIANGEIGKVLSICATNHGKCPFGWFVEKDKSGGGAIIDHVVHVADLLRRIVKEDASSVHALVGNNMYSQNWEDSAMLSVQFPSGVFATIDSSWSRSKSYKNWGDLTLKIIGEKGVIELDLFIQLADWYSETASAHGSLGFGSNLDHMMVEEFAIAIQENRLPRTTFSDGILASDIALAAYRSVNDNKAVTVA